MRIISKKILKEFYQKPEFADSKSSLESWHREVLKLDWKTSSDIKKMYASASIINNETVVFNISGNKYRLVVKINYYAKIVFVKFIGTHKEYNKLNLKDF